MQILKKIWQRLTDPIFFRKRFRQLLRCCGKLEEVPENRTIAVLGDFRHVVVVVAHPDDETFCSGLICQLVSAGKTVDLLCLTRGEGGPRGEWTRRELGKVREAEMVRACRVLGIRELVFLDHVDPVAKEHKVFAPDVSAGDLADQMAPYLEKADYVVTHGSSGEYWHPAHLLVHEAVGIAVADRPWMTFLAAREDHPIPKLVNLDDPAHLVLDVSGKKTIRRKALSCHESQASLFRRFAGGSLADFVAKTSIESYCVRGLEID